MSADLLNALRDHIPDTILTSLEASALCARFNPSGVYAGHYLAVGRSDGAVCLYDFETKSIIRTLEGHVKAITAICWSRKCRFLASASRDWNIIIWDLKTGDRRNTIRFDAPNQAETIFIDLADEGARWELLMEANLDGEEVVPKGGRRREHATLVKFNPKGDLVFVGSSLGSLYIYDAGTKLCVHHEVICPNASINELDFDPKGTAFITNSTDRCVRVFAIDSTSGVLILQHKFQDLVGRTPWSGCGFSKDGEYISAGLGAGAGSKNAHSIHVWDRATGALLKILEGGKDPVENLDWHPTNAVIASVSDLGFLHVWYHQQAERWAAYAPGFEELEENREYIEAEDEFDILDAETLQQRQMDEQNHFIAISSPKKNRAHERLQTGLTSGNASAPFDQSVDSEDDQDDFMPSAEDDDFAVYKDNGPPPRLAAQWDSHSNHSVPFSEANGREVNLDDEQLLQFALAQIDEEDSRSRKTRRKAPAVNGKK